VHIGALASFEMEMIRKLYTGELGVCLLNIARFSTLNAEIISI
jgi:hypothetical protein